MKGFIETKVDKYNVRHHYNGRKEYYLNGFLHREYGPAVKCADGTEVWYNSGKFHREDGPAIEYSNVEKDWYLNDELLLQEEYKLVPISYRMNIIYE